MSWTAADMSDQGGRVAVVTGANSGIGWHTACELAAHGAQVLLACRDLSAGKRAADRIALATPSARVEVAELDLASISSVRSFVAGRDGGPLDILINNAGVMWPPSRVETEDGFELQFGTNHLGHFVLTGLLLPSLLAAPAARVVTVSSVAHRSGTTEVLAANDGAGYQPHRAYAQSKLANLLFARELQRRAGDRGLALSSVAAHPGLSATGLVSDAQGAGANRMLRVVGPAFVRAFTQSAAAGARATLYAATVAEPGSYTGPQRFRETRGPVGQAQLSELARDDRLARRLWQASEELTGLRYRWPT